MRTGVGMSRGLLVVLALCVLAGCSKLSFVRQDTSRGEFTRTSPEVELRGSDREGALALQLALREGQDALRAGDLDAAAKAAREALRRGERSPGAHTLAALVADRRGDARTAGTHYRRAVELAPTQGGMHNNFGTWLCTNGREAESLQWFESAASIPGYGNAAGALANAGECAQRAGMDEEAGRYLEAALERDPATPGALAALAEREYRAGNHMRARAFVQRRLDAAPADASTLLLASQIETSLGDSRAAARYVRRMREEFPGAVPDSIKGNEEQP